MNLKDKTIAIIGLGYVGLPLAVAFGKKCRVIGYDINPDRIAELTKGFDKTLEVEANDLKASVGLAFTNNETTLAKACIFIVTVPTPVDKANRPNLAPLEDASTTVGKALGPGGIVIYESTVYPGATEEICVPILEKVSGLTFNQDFFVGYSPERINPGDKVHRLQNVVKITSGSTPETSKLIDDLYREIIIAGTHQVKSIRVAEAAKIIENTQRDLNIAFINELAVIFNHMGIDTNEVLDAASTKWNFLQFKPGLVGGHCIGVDPYYLTHKAQELGYQPQVILAGRRINDGMSRYAAQNMIRLMLGNGMNVAKATIGILGITFKENCPDVRNSKVIDLILELKSWGLRVEVMDPWANEDEVSDEYGIRLSQISSINLVDSIVVAVGHDKFRNYDARQLRAMCIKQPRPVIGDLKALYNREELEDQGFSVYRL